MQALWSQSLEILNKLIEDFKKISSSFSFSTTKEVQIQNIVSH